MKAPCRRGLHVRLESLQRGATPRRQVRRERCPGSIPAASRRLHIWLKELARLEVDDRDFGGRRGRARGDISLTPAQVVIQSDSSDRFNDLTVRVRSLLANIAAIGFASRIKPKSSPSAM